MRGTSIRFLTAHLPDLLIENYFEKAGYWWWFHLVHALLVVLSCSIHMTVSSAALDSNGAQPLVAQYKPYFS